jgi:hypothetical protein
VAAASLFAVSFQVRKFLGWQLSIESMQTAAAVLQLQKGRYSSAAHTYVVIHGWSGPGPLHRGLAGGL